MLLADQTDGIQSKVSCRSHHLYKSRTLPRRFARDEVVDSNGTIVDGEANLPSPWGQNFRFTVNVIIILKKPKVWNMFIKRYVNVLVCFQWVILSLPLQSWISLTKFQPCTFWVGCHPMFCPKIADFDESKLWKPPLSISSHCLCWFVSYQFRPSVYVWQTC